MASSTPAGTSLTAGCHVFKADLHIKPDESHIDLSYYFLNILHSFICIFSFLGSGVKTL